MQRVVGVLALAAVAAAAPAHAKEKAKEGSAAEAEAQPARRVGLRDALQLAVRQNPTLASEAIDIGIADAAITETYGLDDWMIDAGAKWSSTRLTPLEGGAFEPLAVDQVDLSGSVTAPLESGGSVSVGLAGQYKRQVIDVPAVNPFMIAPEQTSWSPNVTATFFQPLMKGFGEKARNGRRRQLRVDRSVQEMERENVSSDVVRQVVEAYWDLAYALEALEIQKQSLALAQEQLRVTSALVEAGKLARTERLAVEQIIAEREQAVLVAEQLVSDRSIQLRQLVGMEIGPGEIDLVAADRLETAMHEPDLDEVLQKALANNPQLKIVRARGDSAAIFVEVTENGLLPQLDFNAHAGPSGRDIDIGGATSQLVTFDNYEVGAGITFKMFLGNNAAEGRTEQAKGQLRKIKVTEQDIRAQIAATVVRTVNLVRLAKKSLETAEKGSKLAAQNIDAEKVRWEQGRSTNFDVLKRQDELAQSRLREAKARADYLKAMAGLDALTGEILTRYGIELTAAE